MNYLREKWNFICTYKMSLTMVERTNRIRFKYLTKIKSLMVLYNQNKINSSKYQRAPILIYSSFFFSCPFSFCSMLEKEHCDVFLANRKQFLLIKFSVLF